MFSIQRTNEEGTSYFTATTPQATEWMTGRYGETRIGFNQSSAHEKKEMSALIHEALLAGLTVEPQGHDGFPIAKVQCQCGLFVWLPEVGKEIKAVTPCPKCGNSVAWPQIRS